MLDERKGDVRTPGRFAFDVCRAAEAAGVEAVRAAVAEGIAPFADYFCNAPVELRTTTRPEASREVSFRFVDEAARGEVFDLARRWYGLSDHGSDFMAAIHSAFGLRAEGIDVDARTGFRKVWAFLDKGYRGSRFATLAGAPQGLAAVLSVLERFGLDHISIVGTDHHNGTCNLYPMLAPGWSDRSRVAELASVLGFAPASDELLNGIEHAVAANFTFDMTSDLPLRMAFYRPVMGPAFMPRDPVLLRFAADCPVVAAQRAYVAALTFGREGHYEKLEVDYDGGIVPVLVRCAQVPPEGAGLR